MGRRLFWGRAARPAAPQFGGEGGVVAEFALLDQLVAGVVAVAGQLMVETAFGNQAVEDVVGKAVARTVFIGQAD